jgi:hypothetical protein
MIKSIPGFEHSYHIKALIPQSRAMINEKPFSLAKSIPSVEIPYPSNFCQEYNNQDIFSNNLKGYRYISATAVVPSTS